MVATTRHVRGLLSDVSDRLPIAQSQGWNGRRRVHLAQILETLVEEGWRNVYAGELQGRPPGAPTTEPDIEALGRRSSSGERSGLIRGQKWRQVSGRDGFDSCAVTTFRLRAINDL